MFWTIYFRFFSSGVQSERKERGLWKGTKLIGLSLFNSYLSKKKKKKKKTFFFLAACTSKEGQMDWQKYYCKNISQLFLNWWTIPIEWMKLWDREEINETWIT